MARLQNSAAQDLRSQLTAAIAHSRALLGTHPAGAAQPQRSNSADDPADRLTGMELSFDESMARDSPAEDSIDLSSLSDSELDALLDQLSEATREVPRQRLLEDLQKHISHNPLPWTIAAIAVGVAASRLFFEENPDATTKNPPQNASQITDHAITHGSLLGQIMKTGFETAKPALLEATKGWLSRFVVDRS